MNHGLQTPMTTKTKAFTVAAALVTLTFWIVGYYQPDLMAQLPPGGESVITLGLSSVISWITPNPDD